MSLEQVKEFHEAFGHPVAPQVGSVDRKTFELRIRLIEEELNETIRDFHAGDLVKTVDGLADLTVVINGSILVFGGYAIASEIKTYRPDFSGLYIPNVQEMTEFFSTIFDYIRKTERYYIRGNVFGVLNFLIEMVQRIYDLCDINGIPIDEVNEAVHKANMSKLGEDGKPIYRESDNKILKGPNFRPPEEDIEAILKAHGVEL